MEVQKQKANIFQELTWSFKVNILNDPKMSSCHGLKYDTIATITYLDNLKRVTLFSTFHVYIFYEKCLKLSHKTKRVMKCIIMPHTDLNTCTRNTRISTNRTFWVEEKKCILTVNIMLYYKINNNSTCWDSYLTTISICSLLAKMHYIRFLWVLEHTEKT